MSEAESPANRGLSRRKFLGTLGIAGAGVVVGAAGGAGAALAIDGDGTAETVAFRGFHQAGIATEQQDRLQVAAFDLVTANRSDVIELLKKWTTAAEKMCKGGPVGAVDGTGLGPPADTGESIGLSASKLTITFGFGPGLFESNGVDRYGLANRRPPGFTDLPPFRDDFLKPENSGGDLVIQACANDPQVTFHAIRNLTRIGRGVVELKWSQLGFGRTSSTSRSQDTPRNLMGNKDGTDNIKSEDVKLMNDNVWVGKSDQPAWLNGGTYMVCRRIRMLIESWDRTSLDEQEKTIGRHKFSGAPLGKVREFDAVDLNAKDSGGRPVIPLDAHIRLANPEQNNGSRILRRGYSFTDGLDPDTAQLDAGLFFIAFQRDLNKGFIPIQRQLSMSDALNEYIKVDGSAVFVVPPGTSAGGWVGETLFNDH